MSTRKRELRTQRTPREVLTKSALDRRVAEILGVNVSEISLVTGAFLHEVLTALVDGHEVRLDGVGTMSVRAAEMKKPVTLSPLRPGGPGQARGERDKAVAHVRRKYYVKFRKSNRLRDAIKARHGTVKARRKRDGKIRRR